VNGRVEATWVKNYRDTQEERCLNIGMKLKSFLLQILSVVSEPVSELLVSVWILHLSVSGISVTYETSVSFYQTTRQNVSRVAQSV
jgi:hypothetical protein